MAYFFPWEEEHLRASYDHIEFRFDLAESDQFNNCFEPRPPNYGTDYMEMLEELGLERFYTVPNSCA